MGVKFFPLKYFYINKVCRVDIQNFPFFFGIDVSLIEGVFLHKI